MIPDRSPITSKLIDFLAAVKPGAEISHKKLAEVAESPDSDIKSKVRSAMHHLKTHQDMIFGSIRGIGYRRLTDEEIALNAPAGIRRATRLRNRETKKIDCIDKIEALSPRAQASVYVSQTIWAGLATATNDLKKRIDIATIDGRATIAGIMDARTKND
jgi:hypothetical protein